MHAKAERGFRFEFASFGKRDRARAPHIGAASSNPHNVVCRRISHGLFLNRYDVALLDCCGVALAPLAQCCGNEHLTLVRASLSRPRCCSRPLCLC